MAAMHQDKSEDREVVSEKLNEVFAVSLFSPLHILKWVHLLWNLRKPTQITSTTPMAREVVVEVCNIVTERGARLVGLELYQ